MHKAHIGPFKQQATLVMIKMVIINNLLQHNRTWDHNCKVDGNMIYVWFNSPYAAVDFEEDVMAEVRDFIKSENETWVDLVQKKR